MREIKFRGKDEKGKWCFGDLIKGFSKIFVYKKRSAFAVEIDLKTVGEFTGLKDIDGKEIFEGDILESAEKPDSYSFGFWEVEDKTAVYGFTGHCGKMKISGKPFRRVVKWHEERAAFCLFLPLTDTVANSRPLKMVVADDRMRVIGNIHDNPDLLKEGD